MIMKIVGMIASTIMMLVLSLFMWVFHSDEKLRIRIMSWLGAVLSGAVIAMVWSGL
jgi:hypothetical protein